MSETSKPDAALVAKMREKVKNTIQEELKSRDSSSALPQAKKDPTPKVVVPPLKSTLASLPFSKQSVASLPATVGGVRRG